MSAYLQGGDLLDWTSDKGIQMDAFIQRIDALSTMGCAVPTALAQCCQQLD